MNLRFFNASHLSAASSTGSANSPTDNNDNSNLSFAFLVWSIMGVGVTFGPLFCYFAYGYYRRYQERRNEIVNNDNGVQENYGALNMNNP